MKFEYKTLPNKVIFGQGKFALLKSELEAYDHILLLGEKRFEAQIHDLMQQMGPERFSYISEIAQHVPKELVDKTFPIIAEKNIQAIVAVGGGSTIGLAKALVLRKHLPIIAVPTTYAGSEMTNIYGITEAGEKVVGRDDRVLPSVVIYDPQFTSSMPLKLAATSGVNALAHLIEALYADNVNPVTYQVALKGTEHIIKGLEALVKESKLTAQANEDLLLGAYLAGKSLCEVNMALHHKAAHTLGGSFGMEHSQVHTVLLIYILAFQWNGLSEALKADLQRLFKHKNPAQKLHDLVSGTGSAVSLQAIGFKEEDIEKAADIIAKKEFANPVAYHQKNLSQLIRNAYEGNLDF